LKVTTAQRINFAKALKKLKARGDNAQVVTQEMQTKPLLSSGSLAALSLEKWLIMLNGGFEWFKRCY
jgi:hypothetical protein